MTSTLLAQTFTIISISTYFQKLSGFYVHRITANAVIFYPQKSYRHPALRDQALACVVYDDWQILGTKVQLFFENSTKIYFFLCFFWEKVTFRAYSYLKVEILWRISTWLAFEFCFLLHFNLYQGSIHRNRQFLSPKQCTTQERNTYQWAASLRLVDYSQHGNSSVPKWEHVSPRLGLFLLILAAYCSIRSQYWKIRWAYWKVNIVG